MFRQEGPARTTRANEILAGSLALTAGFVNAAGFVVIGSYTSHVTGSVGRLAIAAAARTASYALGALAVVATFFAGAFVASLLVGGAFRRVPVGYGVALIVEAALVASFALASEARGELHPIASGAAVLSFAMGMQNSLVTRLSGAVVRTTHLTGVVTDLGIEAARWTRWLCLRVDRPEPERGLLLGTIALAFTLGAILGASAALHLGRASLAIPAAVLLVGGVHALRTPPSPPADRAQAGDAG